MRRSVVFCKERLNFTLSHKSDILSECTQIGDDGNAFFYFPAKREENALDVCFRCVPDHENAAAILMCDNRFFNLPDMENVKNIEKFLLLQII